MTRLTILTGATGPHSGPVSFQTIELSTRGSAEADPCHPAPDYDG